LAEEGNHNIDTKGSKKRGEKINQKGNGPLSAKCLGSHLHRQNIKQSIEEKQRPQVHRKIWGGLGDRITKAECEAKNAIGENQKKKRWQQGLKRLVLHRLTEK